MLHPGHRIFGKSVFFRITRRTCAGRFGGRAFANAISSAAQRNTDALNTPRQLTSSAPAWWHSRPCTGDTLRAVETHLLTLPHDRKLQMRRGDHGPALTQAHRPSFVAKNLVPPPIDQTSHATSLPRPGCLQCQILAEPKTGRLPFNSLLLPA